MAFELGSVVPWGRSFEEYTRMFSLDESDLDKKIIGFGDGPAEFNCGMWKRKKRMVSVDPLYRFSKEDIKMRIDETVELILEQTRGNTDNFIWKSIRDVDHLAEVRIGAMERFLDDYEAGTREGRYRAHSLPDRTDFDDGAFDLGLSSHFLVLYSQLGLQFHINALSEMMRICREVRIFPLLSLDASQSEILAPLLTFLQQRFYTEIVPVDYEFQKGGNKMLVISHMNA